MHAADKQERVNNLISKNGVQASIIQSMQTTNQTGVNPGRVLPSCQLGRDQYFWANLTNLADNIAAFIHA